MSTAPSSPHIPFENVAARRAPARPMWRRFLAAVLVAFALGGLASPVRAWADTPSPSAPKQDVAALVEELPPLAAGVLETPRFRIVYTSASKVAAQRLAADIERVRDDFQKVLGRDWPGVTEIRVGLGRSEFEGLAVKGGAPPPWAAALAYPGMNIVLLEARSLQLPRGETTLRHELAHVALGRLGEGWPRWFHEGLAMYLTGDRFSLTQYAALFRGVTQKRIFPFSTLESGWPAEATDVDIAYAQALSFVEFLIERHGAARMGALVDQVREGKSWDEAFRSAFQSEPIDEERDWRETLPSRYSWMPIVGTGSTLWAIAAVLCVLAWHRRRGQSASRRVEMDREEAAELAAAEAAHLAAIEVPSNVPGSAPGEEGPWQLSLWPDDERLIHAAEVAPAVEDDGPKRTLH